MKLCISAPRCTFTNRSEASVGDGRAIMSDTTDPHRCSVLSNRSDCTWSHSRPARLFALCLFALMFGPGDAASAVDADSLANERVPVNRLRMEAQWGVDCDSALDRVRDRAAIALPTEGTSSLSETLTLCGFIYNTPGTQTYRVCPDYGHWRNWLDGERDPPEPCD